MTDAGFHHNQKWIMVAMAPRFVAISLVPLSSSHGSSCYSTVLVLVVMEAVSMEKSQYGGRYNWNGYNERLHGNSISKEKSSNAR